MNEFKTGMTIPFETKTVTLEFMEDDHLDMEDMLHIDSSNIIGELLTFPVRFNQVGILKGDIENLYSQQKMRTDIELAQLQEKVRAQLIADGKKATVAEVENGTMTHPEYAEIKMRLFEVKKKSDYIDSLYWAAKSKDKKLDILSAKIKPEEFEQNILEGAVNKIMIKYHKNLM